MSSEAENENRRRLDQLRHDFEKSEIERNADKKIQEANMKALKAEHRTSQAEVLKVIAEQGKEIIRTVMIAAFGIIAVITLAVAVLKWGG